MAPRDASYPDLLLVKRVLVTGASGFIGRHVLAPLIARGFEVHAIRSGHGRPADAPPDVQWHVADLLDVTAATRLVADVRPTDLLHLAWYAVPGLFWTAAENAEWARASAALADAVIAHGGERLVGAGTCAEYQLVVGHVR